MYRIIVALMMVFILGGTNANAQKTLPMVPPPDTLPPPPPMKKVPVILPSSQAVAVVVQVVDVVTKKSIVSTGGIRQYPDGSQWLGVFLFRVGVDGSESFIAGSDCYDTGNGCPDRNGTVTFQTDFGGNSLPSGKYEVVAFADCYYVGKQDLGTLPGGANAMVTVSLQPHAVKIQVVAQPTDLPDSGGTLVWSYQITNTLGKDLDFTVVSDVDTQVAGVGVRVNVKKDSNGRKLKYRLSAGQSVVITQQVAIPSMVGEEIPFYEGNAGGITISIRAVGDNPWDALGSTEIHVVKGKLYRGGVE